MTQLLESTATPLEAGATESLFFVNFYRHRFQHVPDEKVRRRVSEPATSRCAGDPDARVPWFTVLGARWEARSVRGTTTMRPCLR